jgi:hypothetical protein
MLLPFVVGTNLDPLPGMKVLGTLHRPPQPRTKIVRDMQCLVMKEHAKLFLVLDLGSGYIRRARDETWTQRQDPWTFDFDFATADSITCTTSTQTISIYLVLDTFTLRSNNFRSLAAFLFCLSLESNLSSN